jgi:hypothetical protein
MFLLTVRFDPAKAGLKDEQNREKAVFASKVSKVGSVNRRQYLCRKQGASCWNAQCVLMRIGLRIIGLLRILV